ncbi:MAG: protein phosphatase 2C domain-containing protein [Nocardioidaceae bacterium]
MSLALRYSATSDTGRVRKNNQDSGFASDQLLVVADGMGGAAAGDLASAVTVQTVRRLHGGHPDDMLEALAGAVHRANDRLGEIIEEDPSVEGMGTTVTAIMFDGDGDTIGLAHIGDSRAYLLRDGLLEQLTQDHTFVQGLVDEGRISENEARTHPHRSLLLRALDGRHDTEPDLTTLQLQPGDRLLVCSDGLCGYVDDDAIKRVLSDGTPDSASLELLRLALEAGGPDNITCVVGDVVDATTPVDPASAAAAVGPMLVGAAAEQPRGRIDDTASQPPVDMHAGAVDADADADPEELRYAPRPPRRFRWLRRIALLLILLVVLVFAGKFAYDWTQDQYYVADFGDNVAIYQGIDADVPVVAMSSLFEQSGLELSALPNYWRDRVVDGIDATGLANAENIVRELEDAARVCAEASEPAPTTSPSPGETASPRAGGSPDQTRTPDRSPTDDRTSREERRQRGSSRATARSTGSPTPSPTASDGSGEESCVGATS